MNKKCSGCGAILQTHSNGLEGYVKKSVYDKSIVCERCFKIKHYGGMNIIDKNQDFNEIVRNIEKDSSENVFLIDLLTLTETDIKILKCFKKCKYVLLTKNDLLPKSVREKKLINYFTTHYGNYKVMCVSAKKKNNIDAFVRLLEKDNVKRIHVLGLTNSGKSSLVNAIIESMGGKGNITTSSVPNTTLEFMNIKLDNGITIIDTPGFLNEESIYNVLGVKESTKLMAKKEIKPRIYNMRNGYTLYLDNILRIDFLSEKSAYLIFYVNEDINIKKSKSCKNEDMKMLPKKNIHINKNTDITIEGLGFIKVTNECDIIIYSLDERLIKLRDKLI